MDNRITISIDGKPVTGRAGQTVLEVAEAAHVYVPRLCHYPGLESFGSCRVCTVLVNGRPQAACTLPVAPNMVVENDTARVLDYRKSIIEMLFVEGNHFCMFCEKSGNCELQALAYRFGITAPRYPYQFPRRHVDASHPDVLIDHNRCVLCARCIRASRDQDGKNVFQFVGRGPDKRVGVNGDADLASTNFAATDAAADVCPVGAILRKRTAYAIPVGLRAYDHTVIGADVETGAAEAEKE